MRTSTLYSNESLTGHARKQTESIVLLQRALPERDENALVVRMTSQLLPIRELATLDSRLLMSPELLRRLIGNDQPIGVW